MKIHSPPPTKSPVYKQPPAYVRPEPDREADLAAAKANELLNLRSQGISNIIKQREEAGSRYAAHSAIKLPPANPRTEELHKELGIDKVVTVKCPFEIDTTPGGYYKTQGAQALTQDVSNGGKGKLRDMWMPGARESATPPPRPDALEYSANGTTAPAFVDGRLLRGGWAAY